MILRIVLSNSIKNWVVILMGIALNLHIDFGSMSIITILILPIQEHRHFWIFWGLHGLCSSKTWISCHTKLWFVWVESHQDILYCFLGFLFLSFSISFPECCLSFMYRNASDLLELILYSATLLMFISCRLFFFFF